MPDPTATDATLREAIERLTDSAQRCTDAARDGHSLRLFDPLPFGRDITAVLAALTTANRDLSALRQDHAEMERERVRMVKKLTKVCDEIAASEDHGDGADDPDCEICRMHKTIRTALTPLSDPRK